LKSKVVSQFSTFNVRTLNRESQISELVASVDVISLQEHRFFHEESLKYLITTSCWKKNLSNSSVGGVGLLLSPLASSALISIEKISPRITIATFNGNPFVTVISCYSLTNVSDENEVSDFYDDLSSPVRSVPNTILWGSPVISTQFLKESKLKI